MIDWSTATFSELETIQAGLAELSLEEDELYLQIDAEIEKRS